jgi:DNA-binding NtrC family response regulator
MSLTMQTREEVPSGLLPNISEGARVLVVCDDDFEASRLKTLLLDAGIVSHCAKTLTAGCDAAKSGQFQVVVSIPYLRDGSWRRISDIANHYDLRYEVVLWAHNFDLREWAEAMDQGAFDVLDAIHEESRIGEVIKCALWVAYLKGAGPYPRAISSPKVA